MSDSHFGDFSFSFGTSWVVLPSYLPRIFMCRKNLLGTFQLSISQFLLHSSHSTLLFKAHVLYGLFVNFGYQQMLALAYGLSGKVSTSLSFQPSVFTLADPVRLHKNVSNILLCHLLTHPTKPMIHSSKLTRKLDLKKKNIRNPKLKTDLIN